MFKVHNFKVCSVMVENCTGLLLQAEWLRCHLAAIYAVTVLDRLTEAEDGYCGGGPEYVPSVVGSTKYSDVLFSSCIINKCVSYTLN